MADQWPRWWEIMTEGLGAKLREVRTAKGMSLRSLAQALGVSASLISQVEIGKTQPSVSTLFAMANHLGVSLDELVGNVPTAGGSRGPSTGTSLLDLVHSPLLWTLRPSGALQSTP